MAKDNNTLAIIESTKHEMQTIQETVKLSTRDNYIQGEYLPDFMLTHFLDRIDPIEYCQNILRDHLPESKKYLHENQVELIRAACNPKIKQVAGIMARQTGKTESIASMSGYLLDNYPQMRIGIFTPRLQQAEVTLGRLSTFFQMNEDRLNNRIEALNKDKIQLSNNSVISAVSASDQSNIEGLTFDVIILDEAQKISNYTWSERISPMGGATNAKLIKIGTPKTRNHFYDAIEGDESVNWKVVRRDWTRCPQLWALDAIKLPDKDTGKLRDYSRYVVEKLMPKALKQFYFPNNPEIWTPGSMSIEDFKTQYMLEFVDGAGKFLTKDQLDVLTSGDFDWLEQGELGESYVAGIDFAGSSKESDATHITVIRECPNGERHKVWSMEILDMPYNQQMYEIANLFGGYTPKFMVRKIFADQTGCGAPLVNVLQTEFGLTQMEGIYFNGADVYTSSGMNLKNVMYQQFKLALDAGKFKYPTKERFLNSPAKSAGKDHLGFYHKMLAEWSDLECETRQTANKKIGAPDGQHDDVCSADILANFCCVAGRKRMPRATSARMYRRM